MDYTADAWTAYREVDANGADAESDDGQAPTNTFMLDDNCYYVTVAYLAGMDTNALITVTEHMQIAGGAPLDIIAGLFDAAGLLGPNGAPPAYQAFSNVDQVESAVAAAARGFDGKGGLAYTRANGTGHMVVVDTAAQQVRYLDYQSDPNGADAVSDVQQAAAFYLFFPVVPRR